MASGSFSAADMVTACTILPGRHQAEAHRAALWSVLTPLSRLICTLCVSLNSRIFLGRPVPRWATSGLF